MRFELTTPTLARLCSTPELRPHIDRFMHHQHNFGKWALFVLHVQPPEAVGRIREKQKNGEWEKNSVQPR